jgi:dTDP-4-amino-4,6-dideoxygalactose transaminase
MKTIRWNEPRFDEEELNEIKKVLDENYVNEGPKTRELENTLKNYLEVKHIILTTNATAALFLALKAEVIKRDVLDFEVIVPDFTMFATATAVNWAGGTPVFVDCKKEDLTIDVSKIKEKITEKTIAIVPVHILGRAAEMDALLQLAKEHNLFVIEDAAGALGSKFQGKFLGTIGDIGCFSLQSNKIITSGQGGIIALNDDKTHEIIRRLRDFGRFSNKEFLHETIGYNLKFSDLAAALALAQFKKINSRKEMLIKQYNSYKNNLLETSEIKFFELENEEIPLWIDVEVIKKEELKKFLEMNNIFCRDAWPSLHRNPPYTSIGTDKDYPNSSYASDNILWLPNGPALDKEKIEYICSKIKDFYMEKHE